MKTIKYISLVIVCIFCSLTLIAGSLGYFFTDNIKAVLLFMNHSKDELELMLDQTYREVDDFLEDNPQYEVRPSNKVEEKLHHEKIISDAEFLDILTGKIKVSDLFGTEFSLDDKNNLVDVSTGKKVTAEQIVQMRNNKTQNGETSNHNNTSQSGAPPSPPPSSPQTSAPDEQASNQTQNNSDKISAKIAKMYVLKSTFISSLDALYTNAIARYNALPASQKESGKDSIISELYPKAAQLEKQCDAEVKTVLAELTALLKEDGQSLDLIDRIKTAYYQEKSVRKAIYMEKL